MGRALRIGAGVASGVALALVSVVALTASAKAAQSKSTGPVSTPSDAAVERAREEARRAEAEAERLREEARRLEREAHGLSRLTGEQADQVQRFEKHIEILRGGGRLGVRLEDVTPDDVKTLKLSLERGALVGAVEPGSPAEEAGLAERDVIVGYQGQHVESASALARMVRETPAGRTVSLDIVRDGKERTSTATLGKRGAGVQVGSFFEEPVPHVEMPPVMDVLRWTEEGGPQTLMFHGGGSQTRLGVVCREIQDQLAEYFGLDSRRGVLVESVIEDSAAARAGVKAGDVILSLDGEQIRDVRDLREEVADADEGDELTLQVLRDGKKVDLEVVLARKGKHGGTPKPARVGL